MGNTLGCCCNSQYTPVNDLDRLPLHQRKTLLSPIRISAQLNDSLYSTIDTTVPDAERIKKELYEEFIAESKIDDLFDHVLEQNVFKRAIPQAKKLCEGSIDENNTYFVEIADIPIDKVRYHETRQIFKMSYTPDDYMYFMMLQDMENRKKGDSTIETHELLYVLEKNDVKYFFTRITTKKILMMKGKEIIMIKAYKKHANGFWMDAYKSFDHPEYPITDDLCRIVIHQGAVLYEPLSDRNGETSYKTTMWHYINPQVSVSLTFLKGFMSSYYKKVYKQTFIGLAEYKKEGKDDWNNQLMAIMNEGTKCEKAETPETRKFDSELI